jgi:hypothetical protein
MKRLRLEREPRTLGQKIHDREADARYDLIDGRGMTADGGIIDFESDSQKPRL